VSPSLEERTMTREQKQGRADALGRFVAAAQAEADRFHGAGAVRTWQPRQVPRRRPSMATIAVVSMAAVAVAAGAWLMQAVDPAEAPQPSAATAPAPWFVAVAQAPEVVTAEAAKAVAASAAPVLGATTVEAAAPLPAETPPVDDAPPGLMNVPNLPDDGAQVADESQETSYDQGDGGVVPEE